MGGRTVVVVKEPAEGCCGEQETSALCKRFHLTAVLNVFYLLFQREVKSRRNAEETTIM